LRGKYEVGEERKEEIVKKKEQVKDKRKLESKREEKMTKGTEAVLVDSVHTEQVSANQRRNFFSRWGAGLGPKYVRHYTIQGLLKD
jgi:hypothetical protein